MAERDLRRGDRIGRFEIASEGPVAVQGLEGCTSARCTRIGSYFDPATGRWEPGLCVGWHCPRCGQPTSMMGHDCEGEGT